MKLSTLLTITAVLSAVFGVAFLLVPEQLGSLYGIEARPILFYTARLLGSFFVMFATLTWFARNADDSAARRAIVLALFIGNAVGFVFALIGQLNNVVGALGWSTVALFLLLALGYGYFQFVKPAPGQAPSFGE